jgi:hypothetical protein
MDSTESALPGATVEAVDRAGESAFATADEDGRYEISVRPGTYRVSASLAGFATRQYDEVRIEPGRTRQLDFRLEVGSVAESVTVLADEEAPESFYMRKALEAPGRGTMAPAAPPPPRPISRAMREGSFQTAQAQALGDQFEYKLPHPVTIGRNRSALLPIVQTELSGEKLSVYNERNGDPRPRLAIWLANESGLTLDAGSFTVLDGDAFAGEGLTDVIRPKEKRLLSYGLDLHTDVIVRREGAPERVTGVVIARGLLKRQAKLQRKVTYLVRNQDDARRVVLVEHPVEAEWSLVDTPAPAETTATDRRFRVEAAPGATTELVVQEESTQETTYALSNVTGPQITLWLEERAIDPDVERVLREIVAKRDRMAAVQAEMASRDQEQSSIFRDQERLRENLEKLGDSSEEKGLRRRYVAELEKQENRLETIRAERKTLEADWQKLQQELDELVKGLAFEKSS